MVKIIQNLILAIIVLSFSNALYAQVDVTKFLGIPIDGYKSEMIKKLKSKGFTVSPLNKDVLIGEFNGKKVNLHIGTNNNKVYRIMVAHVNYVNEGDIKIMFNNLCEQFKSNKRYLSLTDDMIPEEEDISYQLTVNNKRYQAVYYQLPESVDSNSISKEIKTFLFNTYTKEQLTNSSEEFQKEIISKCTDYLFDKYSNKPVWFMINEQNGEYYITMFYDNALNKASGDDL